MDRSKVLVLATPGLGLTVVCTECSPNVDIFTDPFDSNMEALDQALEVHEKEAHK